MYASVAEYQATYADAPASTETDAALAAILARASDTFDSLTGRSFAVATSASARDFYGAGTPFLAIDPYVAASLTTVTMPDGYTVPDYAAFARHLQTTDGAGRLYTLDRAGSPLGASVWPDGVAVTVTANWGASAIPGDVKEAVLAMAAEWWRDTYAPAREGSWRGTSGTTLGIPARAQAIIDRYARARALRVAF